jgi:hypothetical protein
MKIVLNPLSHVISVMPKNFNREAAMNLAHELVEHPHTSCISVYDKFGSEVMLASFVINW